MQVQSSSLTLNKPMTEVTPTTALQEWLVSQLADQLSLDAKTIKVTEPLTRYGLDSIDAVTLVGDLEDMLNMELPSTLFWDHPTIEKSAHYLAENFDISKVLDQEIPERETARQEVLEPVTTAGGKKGWGNLFGRIIGA